MNRRRLKDALQGVRVLLGLSMALALVARPVPAATPTPPEVTRVRVPAAEVERWFPPGEELTGMTTADFDRLLQEATSPGPDRADHPAPRLLRARHFARWDGAMLIGRSEFVLDVSPPDLPGEVALEPWTPAVVPELSVDPSIRSDSSGKSFIRVVGPQDGTQSLTVSTRWQLLARAGSEGRRFALGLGPAEVNELKLELPEGLEPEGPIGVRRGPEPGTAPATACWTFFGRGALSDLRVFRPEGQKATPDAPRLWSSTQTNIDTAGDSANWETDLLVSRGAWSPRKLVVDLDPGLKLVGVTGPAVEDFDSEPSPDATGSTRLTVRLSPPGAADGLGGTHQSSSTTVKVRALAAVPSEGDWSIPSAIVVDAVWTGGQTTVRLDPSRILADLRPRNGRRTQVRSATAPTDNLMVFESDRQGPVAELELRKPWAAAASEVRGTLKVGTSAPRLEGRISWTFQRGRLNELVFDLPATWTAERVEVLGIDSPIGWFPEPLKGGGTRVRVNSPAGVWSDRDLTLNLTATASVAPGRGPLALPRVRPVGVHVSDELWVAYSEPPIGLRPTLAKGLAWIDPESIPPAPVNPLEANSRLVLPTPAADRPVLAWRWVDDDAEARVERERTSGAPPGTVELQATVSGTRLRIDGHITVSSAEGVAESLLIEANVPAGAGDGWRFFEEGTGQELDRDPIDDAARVGLGLPGRGPAWRVKSPGLRTSVVGLIARYEAPWAGEGAIPLLFLPRSSQTRGVVLVRAGRGVRTSLKPEGVRALDPETTLRTFNAWTGTPATLDLDRDSDPGVASALHAFEYDSPTDSVGLRTETLAASAGEGVIRDAFLTSTVTPGSATRHLLTLRVLPDRTTNLGVVLPPGTHLERVERDGRPETPTRIGGGLSIGLGDPTLSGASVGRGMVVVSLEYLGEPLAGSGRVELDPGRPLFSLPCLSFSWQVVSPGRWRVSDWGTSLVAADPTREPISYFERVLGSVSERVSASTGPLVARGLTAAEARGLDARLLGVRPEDLNLGEWFMRWDAGNQPVVIDRDALRASGWGPRSRLAAPAIIPPAPARGLASLRSNGLEIIRAGGILIVTRIREAREWSGPSASRHAHRALRTAAREAAAFGADGADRFQSATRWREEASPRNGPGGGPDEDVSEGPAGTETVRFVTSGWPATGVSVTLIDRNAEAARAWAFGFLVVTLGLWGRRLPVPCHSALIAVVFSLGAVGMVASPPNWQAPSAGLAGGALAVVCLMHGGRLSKARGRAGRLAAGRRRKGFRLPLPSPVLLAGLATLLTAGTTLARIDPVSRILVVLPYEGDPDPNHEPNRVVLRLADHERLRTLAGGRADPIPRGARATRVEHGVAWVDETTVDVTSDFDLESPGGTPTEWSFPVAGARGIVATVDGKDVPVRVGPGGQTGSVVIAPGPPGRSLSSRLRVRRSVAPLSGDWGASISLPVNPSPSALVRLGPGPRGLKGSSLGARGGATPADGNHSVVRLGPVGRVDVRWLAPGTHRPPSSTGVVEALSLWDAHPAGDRVRTRLTYRAASGTSVVRVGLDPDVLLRNVEVPGDPEVVWEGTPEAPEWVARFDPPLPDGGSVTLDCWRPATETDSSELHPRRPPGVEPLGVEKFSGSLAFRRPPDWLGRIVPGPTTEPIGEDAFVRSWGNLPQDPLTLSGALRLPVAQRRGSLPVIMTGPIPGRLRVGTSLTLTVAAGRLGLDADFTLQAISGGVFGAELILPPDFHPVEVSGDGLTDWSRPAAGRLRLRFDGPSVPLRRLRLRGWLPVPSGTGSAPVAPTELATPWPLWPGQDEVGGTLTVNSSVPVEVTDGAGEPLGVADPLSDEEWSGGGYRRVYPIRGPSDLGRLSWIDPPPRVTVRVESQLTVDPDSAEWAAVLRYDVAGGAINSIYLDLPTEWARNATIELPGRSPRKIVETMGETTRWTLHPDRPIWGYQNLSIRSNLPFPTGASRPFPDVTPRGRGEVDTFLRIVNATRQSVTVAGSPGLQPIAPSSITPDPELAVSAARGVITNTFRVQRSGWSLRLQKNGQGVSGDQTRIERGEVDLTVGADGGVLGFARYDVTPGAEPFLGVGLDEFSRPIWVSVNGVLVRPLMTEGRNWQIPLPLDRPGRVQLFWKTSVSPSIGPGSRALPMPTTGRSAVPTTVNVRVPRGGEVRSRFARLNGTRLDSELLEEAEWARRRAVDALEALALDRTSRTGAENLVASLVRFELILQQAERAAAWAPGQAVADRIAWAEQARQSAGRLRDELTEALRNASFERYGAAALRYLGRIPTSGGTEAETPPTIEASSPLRLRSVGTLWAFTGTVPPLPRWQPLIWETGTVDPTPPLATLLWALGATVLAGLTGFWLGVWGGRSAWPGRAVLTAAMLMATAGAGFVGGAAALVLVGFGCWARLD